MRYFLAAATTAEPETAAAATAADIAAAVVTDWPWHADAACLAVLAWREANAAPAYPAHTHITWNDGKC